MKKPKKKGQAVWKVTAFLWVCVVLVTTGVLWAKAEAEAPFILGGAGFLRFDTTMLVASREGLSLRAQPSVSAKKLRGVPSGSSVRILPDSDTVEVTIDKIPGSFVKVEWGGVQGYLFSGYLVPPFLDLASPPESLEAAVRPWTVGQTAKVPGLKVSDVWVLESQVWGRTRLDGSSDLPARRTALAKESVFLPASSSGAAYAIQTGTDGGTRITEVRPSPSSLEIAFRAEGASRPDPEPANEGRSANPQMVSAARLFADSFETSAVKASLKKGDYVKIVGRRKNPPDVGTLRESLNVESNGQTYLLKKGTSVRIPSYSPTKCSVAFDQGQEEVVVEVPTSAIEAVETSWLQVETRAGLQGWIKSENVAQN